MPKRHTNRVAWGLTAVLAAGVLAGLCLLGTWLRWYWVAKHHGRRADLGGVFLICAPLKGADLERANLRDANLAGANLAEADLENAILRHANLAGANLAAAHLGWANLQGVSLPGASLVDADLDFTKLQSADLRGANLNTCVYAPGPLAQRQPHRRQSAGRPHRVEHWHEQR